MRSPDKVSRSLLITGATGYLGRWVLQSLRASNFRAIYCLSRTADTSAGGGPIQFLRGDLLAPQSYREALQSCHVVLHMGALTGKGTAGEHFRVNAEGTRTLVEECRRAQVSNFLYVSSISAKFPDLRHYHYGQAKKRAEEIVTASGLRYAIVRPTMILGKDSPVLQGLLKMAGGPVVPIMGDGKAKVQPVFAGDVARTLCSMVEQPELTGRTVEIGGADILTIEELLQKIRTVRWGRRAPVVHLPLDLIAWTLAAVEPMLLPLLPLTAGQLASFRNDSTAAVGDSLEAKQPRKGIDEMLRLAVADAN